MFIDRRQSPLVHTAHFYQDDVELLDRLRGITVSSLATGNAVLIVATAEHRRQLTDALHRHWTNWAAARDAGRLVMVDAQETLSQFSNKGRLNKSKFTRVVGDLVRTCRFSAVSANRGLTVYGEMVGLLWDQGHKKAAIDLEKYWNELLADRTFTLHCGYGFGSGEAAKRDIPYLQQICACHNQVLGRALPNVA